MFLPSIKQLQYLIALQQHNHFGRAADACFVTQSTLSAGLRELETGLNAILVERTKRVVSFTALGEQVVRKAYVVLREATDIAQMAQASGRPLSGELRLAVIPTIAPFFLPKALPALRATYPDLKLFLREEMSHAACEELLRGQIDCVLLALPYDCGEVEVAELFEDSFSVAFHEQEFAPAPSSFAPDEIEGDRLLLLEDGHCLRDQALIACERPALRINRAILGTSLHTMVQMVDNRLGLTLLPQMAINSGILNNTNVLARPLSGPRARRTIALAWRRSSPREKELQLLAEYLRNAAKAQR